MSFNFSSLLGTSDLVVDSIVTFDITSDTINVSTLAANKISDSTLTASKLVGSDASKQLTSVTLSAASSNIAVANPSDASITVDLASAPTVTSIQTSSTYMVDSTMTPTQINTIIANTNYSYIFFKAGTYTLTSAIIVQRSNIVLDGSNKAILTLGNSVNQPILLIGNYTVNPPTIAYNNVTIKGFYCDGNYTNQQYEFYQSYLWIPNSCLAATKTSQLVIDSCTFANARSGGLTLVNFCNDVKITNCSAIANYFDGFTWYGTKNVMLNNCYAAGHVVVHPGDLTNPFGGAGASYDNGCQYIIINACCFTGNRLGIYARSTTDSVVSNCSLSGNVDEGLNCSGYGNPSNDNGCFRWTVTGNVINLNSKEGIFMQSCSYFTINANTICFNTKNGISIFNDTAGNVAGTCNYNNISNNVICDNTGTGVCGIYIDASNSYTIGARGNFLSLNIVKNNTAGNVIGDVTSFTVDDDSQINTQQVILKSNAGYSALLNPSSSGNASFTFPPSNGSSGQMLSTNGSGVTSWATPTIVSATSFHVGTGSTSSGSLTYDCACSSAASGIISTLGASQAVPTNPKGWMTLTIAGQGTVAVPFFDQTFI